MNISGRATPAITVFGRTVIVPGDAAARCTSPRTAPSGSLPGTRAKAGEPTVTAAPLTELMKSRHAVVNFHRLYRNACKVDLLGDEVDFLAGILIGLSGLVASPSNRWVNDSHRERDRLSVRGPTTDRRLQRRVHAVTSTPAAISDSSSSTIEIGGDDRAGRTQLLRGTGRSGGLDEP